ncbi:MAG: hypothetical protein L0220_22945, partial [Acidobacteria bacterium]|nr:hypothetical protein [Acidobacteriota bacterium]
WPRVLVDVASTGNHSLLNKSRKSGLTRKEGGRFVTAQRRALLAQFAEHSLITAVKAWFYRQGTGVQLEQLLRVVLLEAMTTILSKRLPIVLAFRASEFVR